MPKTPPLPFSRRALSRLLPVLLLTAAPAAFAQSPYGATVEQLPQPGDPAELLAQALRTLAVEPSNLAALTAAGHNALLLGDPNAAVGFFGRAQEIAPRDGHVKAGLGSALVELEKPQEALRLFAEATRLGVPDEEIAEDRGLAYDLTGDPRRAQRDYAAALAAHPQDDTVRRRLALSQGISGDKAAAIATLDPLIRKRDIAGWRAQTFVLAMNGDAAGASHITHIMLPQQADMLQPFLVRLATLSPADKARAVNFGEMPDAGHAYSSGELANTGGLPTYGATSRTASAAAPAIAAARVATRASDLAPITTRPAAALPPRVAPRVAMAAPTAATPAAPLAGIALAPAAGTTPAPVATQIVPTPAPVRIAQATPAQAPLPSTAGLADLPTPAARGHYDLPHDSNVRSPSRPAPAAVPVPTPVATPVASTQTIGTPVVHGETVKPVVPTPEPKPAKTRLAAADSATRSAASHKPLDESDDAATRRKSTVSDETDAGHGRKGKHASAADESDATGDTAKSRKGAHGKPAADESVDDQGSATSRKGGHGKAMSDETSDDQAASRTRKGAHGKTVATTTDESDDGSAKSRKSAHGKRTVDDDADTSSSKPGKGGDKADKNAKSGKSDKSDKSEKADKSEPERVFVQVAGGANKDDMDKAWASVKKKAPDLMKGRTPQTMPIHATNRLMVGPFKSEEEAQAFVNKMAGKGLSGFTVKTGKKAKVEKVDSGQ